MFFSLEELKALIKLNRLSLQGAKSVHRMLLEGVLPSEILTKIEAEDFLGKAECLRNLEGFSADNEMVMAQNTGTRLISILDSEYPEILKKISDPPILLYAQGQFVSGDSAAIAIVGTRHPSFYGRAQAQKFSQELSQKGITVISGFAHGIDQTAHEAALRVLHGRTIAVLGCGLDIAYPSKSEELRKKIIERGVILSEYGFGAEPRAENFPKRNRIIAGLSLGVLVVEANARSGSLITAHLAVEEGREVFAVPGAVDQPGSRGTHHLIKEGAHLAETAQDLLDALAVPLLNLGSSSQTLEKRSEMPGLTEAPSRAIKAMESKDSLPDFLKGEPLSYEEILEQSAMTSAQVSSFLTFLELQGKVRKTRDGRFSRTNQS